MVLLVSWIYGGMAPMTAMVKWKDVGILEKTDREARKINVAIYANDQLEYKELCWGMDEEMTKSLCTRNKGFR